MFEVKTKGFHLEFNDINIEDAMNMKDAVMKHLHKKNLVSASKDVSNAYNLSLTISNDKQIRAETFNIIRKYAKKFNKITLNEDTAIGIIFNEKENWDNYGMIYAKIFQEAVAPFLQLPTYILSTFMMNKASTDTQK